MAKPGHRSRSLRRVKRRTPGGKISLQRRKRKPAVARCSKCGAKLQGIPRERPHKMKKLAKTKKRPERPYGGSLCSRCLRSEMKTKARQVQPI